MKLLEGVDRVRSELKDIPSGLRWEATLRCPSTGVATKYLAAFVVPNLTAGTVIANSFPYFIAPAKLAGDFTERVLSLTWKPLHDCLLQKSQQPEAHWNREKRLYVAIFETLLKQGVLAGMYSNQPLSGLLINENEFAVFRLLKHFRSRDVLYLDPTKICISTTSVATVPKLYHKDEVLLTRQLSRKNNFTFTLSNILGFEDLVQQRSTFDPEDFARLAAEFIVRCLTTACFVTLRKYLKPNVALQFDGYTPKAGSVGFTLSSELDSLIVEDKRKFVRPEPTSFDLLTPEMIPQALFPYSLKPHAKRDRFSGPAYTTYDRCSTFIPRETLHRNMFSVLRRQKVTHIPRTTIARPFDTRQSKSLLRRVRLHEEDIVAPEPQESPAAPSMALNAISSPLQQFSSEEKKQIMEDLQILSEAPDENMHLLTETKRPRDSKGDGTNALQLLQYRAYHTLKDKTYNPYLDVNAGLTVRLGGEFRYLRPPKKVKAYLNHLNREGHAKISKMKENCLVYEHHIQEAIKQWHRAPVDKLTDFFYKLDITQVVSRRRPRDWAQLVRNVPFGCVRFYFVVFSV